MELGADQGLREYFTYLGPLTLVLVLGLLLIFRAKPLFKPIGFAIIGAHLVTSLLGGARSALILPGMYITRLHTLPGEEDERLLHLVTCSYRRTIR